ncbi:MAG: hypothetical protein KGR26_02405, partial [Cyanobacteria bacterium REEB65]|nr:hypothetical protein [Cyanobacteria bacterium REEB65]
MLAGQKIAKPRVIEPFFRRERLIAALAAGRDPSIRLTLVSAGPGYGKTSTVADYIAATAISGAWVSLDRYDADLIPFLTYLVEAVSAPYPGHQADALALLRSAGEPRRAIPAVCTAIAELLAEGSTDGTIVVLDDFHAVEACPPIAEAVSCLIDYLPESAQLILISRTTPARHIGQLRARRQLLEIGPQELRLQPFEIAAIVEAVAGRRPAEADLAQIERVTAGWAASVVLAAQGMGPLGSAPADNDRIFEYLAQEIFDDLNPATQEFLLLTCHLPLLAAPWCARYLGRTDAGEQIAELKRRNLLLAKGAAGEVEYHYHPVLRAFLQDRLATQVPGSVATEIRIAQGRA